MRRLPTIAGSCAALAAIVALAAFAGGSGSGAGASQPPVLGGKRIAYEAFPQLAFISYSNVGQRLWECTGTVIAPKLVLTAAHCVAGSTGGSAGGTYTVLTGAVESGGGQVSAVSRAIRFPGYRRAPTGFLLYDAALLVLATPTDVPPLRLATPAQAPAPGSVARAEIVGWGSSARSLGRPAARVAAPTRIEPPSRCAGSGRDAVLDPARQLCTADPPRFRTGVCSGDSGGPLVVAAGSDFVEVGVASGAFAAARTHACLTRTGDIWTPAAAISAWARRWIAADSARAVNARAAAPAPPSGRRRS
jgi:secreted trypsin-like serine protease